MKNDVRVNNHIIIPDHELEITASRSGGAGGQHVNKTSTRITVRWNVQTTTALSPEKKELVLQKLQAQLTNEGDLIVHNSTSRSQQHNKQLALAQLANLVRKALHVPKKRVASRVSRAVKEARLYAKRVRSITKKMRSKKFEE